ncbi:MAG: ADP-forming succinate--CoA ligase subunit beta [Candidatus Eisenbacteria bacterium]|nr:ADP-forming succinate--CoA ligase subunit beta [Candidatus Eisenbacteria bacterium]
MKIHEYQAQEIFRTHGIPVPGGRVAASPAEARAIAEEVGVPVMIKAQVHVGGRGKAGGIRRADSIEDAERVAGEILGMEIKGLTVRKVFVTRAVRIASEAYVGVLLDREKKRLTFLVSRAGGVDIEETARTDPDKIARLTVDPTVGLRSYHARTLASALYDDPAKIKAAAAVIRNLYAAFHAVDASLAEINPLITTEEGEVLALDAKINIDDSALFRRKEIEALRDPEADPPAEIAAREAGLSYVALEGTIGCLVNGAGLAMATMDVIQHYGGEPANFLDIGGSSNPGKVEAALRILTADDKVKAILFNIFGGITRCDDVALGLKSAFEKRPVNVPVVIRLTGTNEDRAKEILREAGYDTLTSMDEAVRAVVAAAKGGEGR